MGPCTSSRRRSIRIFLEKYERKKAKPRSGIILSSARQSFWMVKRARQTAGGASKKRKPAPGHAAASVGFKGRAISPPGRKWRKSSPANWPPLSGFGLSNTVIPIPTGHLNGNYERVRLQVCPGD